MCLETSVREKRSEQVSVEAIAYDQAKIQSARRQKKVTIAIIVSIAIVTALACSGIQQQYQRQTEPETPALVDIDTLSLVHTVSATAVVENVSPLAVNDCDCVEFSSLSASVGPNDFTDIIAEYRISNAYHYLAFTLSLPGLDPAYPPTNSNRPYFQFHDPDGNGKLTQFADDTAHSHQRTVNANGDGFILDLQYGGRVTKPPDRQSPFCVTTECPDTVDWVYYPMVVGTLTGIPQTRYEGALIEIHRRNAALQIGTDAHLYSPRLEAGGAIDLTLDVVRQPTTGVTLQTHLETAIHHFTLTSLSKNAPSSPLATNIEFSDSPQATCDLYPLALHQSALMGKKVGDQLEDLRSGADSGTFTWLTWGGSPDVSTLAESLTPPGNSSTYANPTDRIDSVISLGDWLRGTVDTGNSPSVRVALDGLTATDMIVPIWDTKRTTAYTTNYRIAGFAAIRLVHYSLAEHSRLTLLFKGYVSDCNPTAPSTTESTIELLNQTNRTWTYRVIGAGAGQWNLGIADCIDYVVSYSPAGYDVGVDARTGFIGVRWPLANDFSNGEFSITFDRNYPAGNVNVLLRQGSQVRTRPLIGPICAPVTANE